MYSFRCQDFLSISTQSSRFLRFTDVLKDARERTWWNVRCLARRIRAFTQDYMISNGILKYQVVCMRFVCRRCVKTVENGWYLFAKSGGKNTLSRLWHIPTYYTINIHIIYTRKLVANVSVECLHCTGGGSVVPL